MTEARSYFRGMRALRGADFKALSPAPAIPPATPATLEASLLIPAREASHALGETLAHAHAFLASKFGENFEIILIPNPAPGASAHDDTLRLCAELAGKFARIRTLPHLSPPGIPGKGAALRTGFAAACGKTVLFTDADLPYDLSFFTEALRKISQGFDLVTANRRLPESRFDLPTALLSIAYRRHRLGLLFNRAVRLLLPLGTTDTQAGIKVMTRRLAQAVSAKQRCPGFFFDLEIFLVNRGRGWAQTELPVTLRLNTEKSTVRVLRESVLAVYWLLRIAWGFLRGHYGRKPRARPVLSRYRGLGLGTRFFLSLRWRLTPYRKMAGPLPRTGVLYDLGCGHGLFSLDLALGSPERKVVGLDHDEARIEIARQAAAGIPNLSFERGDFSMPVPHAPGSEPVRAVSMIDVLHYFDFPTQEAHLSRAWDLLPEGGVVIFREVDPEGGFIAKLNQFYEKIATHVGFTRSREQRLFFRTREQWLDTLARAGFKARAERCSSLLFADVLYVGEKLGLESAMENATETAKEARQAK